MTRARPDTRRKYQTSRSNPGIPALNSEFGRSETTADIEPSPSCHIRRRTAARRLFSVATLYDLAAAALRPEDRMTHDAHEISAKWRQYTGLVDGAGAVCSDGGDLWLFQPLAAPRPGWRTRPPECDWALRRLFGIG